MKICVALDTREVNPYHTRSIVQRCAGGESEPQGLEDLPRGATGRFSRVTEPQALEDIQCSSIFTQEHFYCCG